MKFISEVSVSFPPLYRKLATLLVLTFLLLWPQTWIEELVTERNGRHQATVEQIMDEWGDTLEVRGPILRIPTKSIPPGETWQIDATVHAIARDLSITGQIDVESRSRGIFKAQVYQGTLTIAGTIDAPAALPGEALLWQDAALLMFYSDRSGIAGAPTLTVGDIRSPMSIGYSPKTAGIHVGARFDVPSPPNVGDPLRFTVTLPFKGVQNLRLTPLALNSTTVLTSNWPSPGFLGDWLPIKREIHADGFVAEFNAAASVDDFSSLELERGHQLVPMAREVNSLGIDLREDVSHYLQVTRAVKYAALFVVLVFAAFFLFETFGGLRLHPIQYAVVGAVQVAFYLLLLSFSEWIPFSIAYSVAAAAVVTSVAGYSRSILLTGARSTTIGIGLLGLYGFMYTLLQLEQQSLIVGSVGLFLALVAFMYGTRKVDWYRRRS